MFISFFRTIKYALVDFYRNFWLSFITMTMIILALLSVNFLLLLQLVSTEAVKFLENKVDISVFFRRDVNDNQIYEVQSHLLSQPQVKEVKLIPKEEALALFRAKHEQDDIILKSLDELKENPLGATMMIKAKSPRDFPAIVEVLNYPKFAPLIAEKNFSEHEIVISKISVISSKVKRVGVIVSALFAFIAVVIVFNTIRIAIYTHRDEIRIMRLVGASDWFIKFPYLIEGVLFSLFACAAVIAVLYPLLQFLQPHLWDMMDRTAIDLVSYFNQNFIYIFGAEFIAASFLSVVSSSYAIRRYLRI
ncbi:MAG: FtsX-like permease family protein [Parcubacteria group bacterium]|nr:FtsX-like permease family protein [Parcubacteria group bacterium]